jgi:hypothetical protein
VDGLEEIAVDKSLATIFEQQNISPSNQCSMGYPPKISTSLPTDFVRNFCCLFQQSESGAGLQRMAAADCRF